MKTKEEAESKLSRCDLLKPVDVQDVTDELGAPRRAYRFENATGRGSTTVEIDADPSQEQLADLARHLPVPEGKRGETLGILRSAEVSNETRKP